MHYHILKKFTPLQCIHIAISIFDIQNAFLALRGADEVSQQNKQEASSGNGCSRLTLKIRLLCFALV